VSTALAALIARGFFSSEVVGVALLVGTVVAVVSGTVGVFTVLRGQSFAGEALGDVNTTGGSAAFLAGVAPLWGFVAVGVAAAGAMELIGIQRPRGRDLATGIVLGFFLGLAALLFYLVATLHNTTGAAQTVLFGSVFTVSSSMLPLVGALGALALGTVALLYRPLLLSSVSAEMAAARGLRVRALGIAYLLALAVAVALAALTIGSILSTALLVGPAAWSHAGRWRPAMAIAVAAGLGVSAMWLGIVLAYDSFDWAPVGTGWPVSFFVVSLIFLAYLLSGLPGVIARRVRVS
jgi:zinc/manganese transport system permease protein